MSEHDFDVAEVIDIRRVRALREPDPDPDFDPEPDPPARARVHTARELIDLTRTA